MLFYGLVSCSSYGKSNDTIKAIEKTDSCTSESKNSYEVYVPRRRNAVEKLPLLVIIDAHGNGKYALNKFKQGAIGYPVVLVASNLIKNGFAGYEEAIRTLIADVRQKYPVDKTVFLSGFSGGARMALGFGISNQLNGLILCGALANSDQIKALRCPVISISGMDDFNFMETAQYLFQEQLTPGNLKIELTNASHSWPDSMMLSNALGFLCLSNQVSAKFTPTDSQVKLYCQLQYARIDSLKQLGAFLNAALVAHNMASTEPFNGDKRFSVIYNKLKNNPGYISQLNRLGQCLQFEINVRQSYIDDFQSKDTLWWKKEIISMDEKIKTAQDSYTKDMYLRIKSFLGIAVYTFCKQAISQENAEKLNKMLSIYRRLEPGNPDLLYFSSFPYFWKGNNVATLSMLKKALKAGFSDRDQLRKDFPEIISSKLF